jgi:hypothetical protein
MPIIYVLFEVISEINFSAASSTVKVYSVRGVSTVDIVLYYGKKKKKVSKTKPGLKWCFWGNVVPMLSRDILMFKYAAVIKFCSII